MNLAKEFGAALDDICRRGPERRRRERAHKQARSASGELKKRCRIACESMSGWGGTRTVAESARKTACRLENGAKCGALDAPPAPIDADLTRLIDVWQTLPGHVRRSIVALVNDATRGEP